MKLLLCLFAAASLFAAEKGWDRIAALKPGAPVEVIVNDHAETGTFVASSTESITIQTRAGERRIPRTEVVRVVSRRSRRLRNALIGVGVGAAVGLVTDQTLGTYLRNESNPDNARALIWLLPIGICGGVAAAFPSYPTVYRK